MEKKSRWCIGWPWFSKNRSQSQLCFSREKDTEEQRGSRGLVWWRDFRKSIGKCSACFQKHIFNFVFKEKGYQSISGSWNQLSMKLVLTTIQQNRAGNRKIAPCREILYEICFWYICVQQVMIFKVFLTMDLKHLNTHLALGLGLIVSTWMIILFNSSMYLLISLTA